MKRVGTVKRALVFIDYDILIRHFVNSGAFRELEREYEVGYVFNTSRSSEKRSIHVDVHSLGLDRVLEVEVPRSRMGAWHALYSVTILHHQRGGENYKPRRDLMVSMFGRRTVRRWTILSLPGVYPLFYRTVTRRMGIFAPLDDLIEREKPDIIIHPSLLTGFYINELLPISRRRDIPLVVLMNSWDNPTSKAMLTGHPDRLVVWGKMSKKYAVRYLHIPEDRVECFGAAQFQIYREPVREPLDELRRMLGVPRGKRILLYAGSAKGAHETRYLRLLETGIEQRHLPDCHVIYRPHPWRGGLAEGEVNFFDFSWKHVTMDPHMADYYRQQARQETSAIYMADYTVTRRLLHAVEGVISPLSTMLLESALLGKPVLMFFPRKDLAEPTSTVTRVALGLVHFTDFWGVDGVNVCMHEEEFFPSCRRLLEQARDPAIASKLREHARRFVVMDGPHYAERLLHLANDLVVRRMPTLSQAAV